MKLIKAKAEHGIVHSDEMMTRFKYNGWPSIAKDDRGRLYATASTMRISHVCPCGKNGMWISDDEGKTWSPTIILNDSNYDDRDTGVLYLGNGKLIVSWFTQPSEDNWFHMQNYDWLCAEDKAICLGHSLAAAALPKELRDKWDNSFVMLSDDYGTTWSEPIIVPVSAPHGCNVCKDGTLIYLGTHGTYKPEEHPDGTSHIELWSSTDGGHTWSFTGAVPRGKDTTEEAFFAEPYVAELPDGRLMGAIRVHTAACLEGTLWTTFSDDKGKTWTDPVCPDEGIDGMPPHILVHSNGDVIMSYACRVNGKRAEKACVSHDNGKTWSEDYIINDDINLGQTDMGYPASVELSDGSILTVYYQCRQGQGWTSVLYSKWNLE